MGKGKRKKGHHPYNQVILFQAADFKGREDPCTGTPKLGAGRNRGSGKGLKRQGREHSQLICGKLKKTESSISG